MSAVHAKKSTGPTRRSLYRRAKKLLIHLLGRGGHHHHTFQHRVRAFLANRSRRYLERVLRDAAFAAAAAFVLLIGPHAAAQSPVDLLEVRTGNGGFVINGNQPGDRAGRSVSSAGDFNGDGFQDILIGAHGATTSKLAAGKAYIAFGPFEPEPVHLADIDAGDGGIAISGFEQGGKTGYSVSYAGDVNGDLFGDIIIGAPANGDAGAAYVIFGKASPAAIDLESLGGNGFAIEGTVPSGSAGWSVSGAGDVNGDGLDDLVIGAYGAVSNGNFRAGKAYVVFGKATTTTVDLANIESGAGGFVIEGEGNFDFTGFSVAGAGDVNNDGLDDVIVGAPNRVTAHDKIGQAFVIHGKPSTEAVNLSNVEAGAGGFVINSASSPGSAGFSVDAAADVNGDGFDDVIVGAPNVSVSGKENAGAAYVVFGKPSNIPVHLASVQAGFGGFAIFGADEDGLAGSSVAAAGDVNGDGIPDVIVGAPETTYQDRTLAGLTYVVFGTTTTSSINLADVADGDGGFPILGANATDESGTGVSAASDLNGDCLCDVLVGAPFAAPDSRTEAGEAYVVFSTAVPELALELWVDFASEELPLGTETNPYTTLRQALCFADEGAIIRIEAGSTPEIITLDRPLTLVNQNGTVRIGAPSE